MPAKSKAQYGLMQGIMHGSIMPDHGPSKSVAKEFVNKTPAKKKSIFAKNLKKHKKD